MAEGRRQRAVGIAVIADIAVIGKAKTLTTKDTKEHKEDAEIGAPKRLHRLTWMTRIRKQKPRAKSQEPYD